MSRHATWLIALAVVVASCGGSPDSDGAPDQTTTTVSGPESSTTTTGTGSDSSTTTATASSSDDTAPSVDESTATVVLDGITYEFGAGAFVGATCLPDAFGGFVAVLFNEDSTEVFSVELWAEGAGNGEQRTNATMYVVTDDGTELDLDADATLEWPAAPAGSSYIDPFEYGGNHASGTIYFIDSIVAGNAANAPLEPMVATFDVTCADS